MNAPTPAPSPSFRQDTILLLSQCLAFWIHIARKAAQLLSDIANSPVARYEFLRRALLNLDIACRIARNIQTSAISNYLLNCGYSKLSKDSSSISRATAKSISFLLKCLPNAFLPELPESVSSTSTGSNEKRPVRSSESPCLKRRSAPTPDSLKLLAQKILKRCRDGQRQLENFARKNKLGSIVPSDTDISSPSTPEFNTPANAETQPCACNLADSSSMAIPKNNNLTLATPRPFSRLRQLFSPLPEQDQSFLFQQPVFKFSGLSKPGYPQSPSFFLLSAESAERIQPGATERSEGCPRIPDPHTQPLARVLAKLFRKNRDSGGNGLDNEEFSPP